jgi:hypothetical protein
MEDAVGAPYSALFDTAFAAALAARELASKRAHMKADGRGLVVK